MPKKLSNYKKMKLKIKSLNIMLDSSRKEVTRLSNTISELNARHQLEKEQMKKELRFAQIEAVNKLTNSAGQFIEGVSKAILSTNGHL